MVVFGITGGSFGTGGTYGSGSGGGVYTGVCCAGGVYAGVGGGVYTGDCSTGGGLYGVYAGVCGSTGGAAWVAASGWKIEAPHFGQKDALSCTSDLQLGQMVTNDLPHPEQYVSPGW